MPFIPKFGSFSFPTPTFKFNRHEQAQTLPQLPLSQEQVGYTPETVFLRQRFHHLRIEFRIENTARDIRDALLQKKEEPYVLKSSWNLFLGPGKGSASISQYILIPHPPSPSAVRSLPTSRSPHIYLNFYMVFISDPLVASGSMEDTLTSSPEGSPLISHRTFTIDRISSPENVRPSHLHLFP